jgi:hypothetical protein
VHEGDDGEEVWEGYNCFNDEGDGDALSAEEKDYIYRLSRYKYNLGVEKVYTKVKKQRRYFDILKQLSEKYHYRVYEPPTLYTEFRVLPKRKKFFNRLKHMLLYRESLVSPYGRLELFNRMERIKVAYSVLREYIRT